MERFLKVTRVLEYLGPESWTLLELEKSAIDPSHPKRLGRALIRERSREVEYIDPPEEHQTFDLCPKCQIGLLFRKYCVGSYGTAKCCFNRTQPYGPHYDVWCPVCDYTLEQEIV